MNILTAIPITFKILASLGLIMILSRFFRQLFFPVLIGVAVLALSCGHSPGSILDISWMRFSSADNIFLMIVIYLVICLSVQMSVSGVMKEFVEAVRLRISQRASMAVLSAVVGLLPMPGGALFSAPLIDDCDKEGGIEPLLKVQINYWFRHIWEYWWPLYPGVLLAMEITGLDALQFILVQIPLSIFSIATGYFFFLRKIEKSPSYIGQRRDLSSFPYFIRLLSPVLLVIFVYVGIRFLFPQITSINKYLPMIFGILTAMAVLQIQRPLKTDIWKSIICSKKAMILLIVVALIRIYGAFIDAGLPDGTLPAVQMRAELESFGIPVLVVMLFIPFITGMTTGLAIGFVGSSFPIVMHLIGENPLPGTVIATTVLACGFGYMGMILSPVHICLIVTNEHFKTRLAESIRSVLKPAIAMLLFTMMFYLLLKWVSK